jgi:hypothetical protein
MSSKDLSQLDVLARQALEQSTRRRFLCDAAAGMGAYWLATQGVAGAAPANSRPAANLHVSSAKRSPGRVKQIIFLHMEGAPSQLELFDYKPELIRHNDQPCPQELLEGQRFAFIRGTPMLLGGQFPFQQHGQSGAWVSDRLPHLAQLVDDICFIKTMQTDQFNHAPAQLLVHTGQPRLGSPSMGSWVTWGLGSENEDLPGFIVLLSGGRFPRVGNALWGSGFLPSVYQGVQCRSQGDPILNVADPPEVSRADRRAMLDVLNKLNQREFEEVGDPETLTRISQFEMAYRMQAAVPEVMDISQEPAHIHKLYGTQPGKESFANNCLLARRLVENGVRFVQLFDWGWDSHGSSEAEALNGGFPQKCREIDQPIAALLTDLKQRGLLDETLIIWGGEFGRTSMRENRGGTVEKFLGRDHNPKAFTMWLAGGGVKPGFTYGATDPLGYTAAENPVPLRDLHATILHLLGIDHRKLSFPFQGLKQKLTGVLPAKVVREILA